MIITIIDAPRPFSPFSISNFQLLLYLLNGMGADLSGLLKLPAIRVMVASSMDPPPNGFPSSPVALLHKYAIELNTYLLTSLGRA